METIELLETIDWNGEVSEQWVLCLADYCHAENGGWSYKLVSEDTAGWLPATHVRCQSRFAIARDCMVAEMAKLVSHV